MGNYRISSLQAYGDSSKLPTKIVFGTILNHLHRNLWLKFKIVPISAVTSGSKLLLKAPIRKVKKISPKVPTTMVENYPSEGTNIVSKIMYHFHFYL